MQPTVLNDVVSKVVVPPKVLYNAAEIEAAASCIATYKRMNQVHRIRGKLLKEDSLMLF